MLIFYIMRIMQFLYDDKQILVDNRRAGTPHQHGV